MLRIKSARGHLYIQSGYLYRFKNLRNGVRYLKCKEKNCPSRARLRVGQRRCENSAHNHPSDEVALEILLFKQELKRRAITGKERPRVLFDDVSLKYPKACTRLGFNSVRSLLYRWKKLGTQNIRLASVGFDHFLYQEPLSPLITPIIEEVADWELSEQSTDSENASKQQDGGTFENSNLDDQQNVHEPWTSSCHDREPWTEVDEQVKREQHLDEEDLSDYQEGTTHADSQNQIRNFELRESFSSDMVTIKEEVMSDAGCESPECSTDLDNEQRHQDDETFKTALHYPLDCQQDTVHARDPNQTQNGSTPSSESRGVISSCSSRPSTPSTPGSVMTTRKNQEEITEYEKKCDLFLDTASAVLANQNRFKAFGNKIAFQLEDMDRQQQVIAEKLISDVLFHGKLGNLKPSATVLTEQPK